MNSWETDELEEIAAADDLRVAPFRADGETYGTPTRVWSVRVDDALYVRAYNGQDSSWYRAAVRENAGRIEVGGTTKEVRFDPVGGPINDRIDDAYREKYEGSPYLNDYTPRVPPRSTRNNRRRNRSRSITASPLRAGLA